MMNTPEDVNVTQLLLDWRNGDASALEKLMPIIYDELRRLAHQRLRRERAGHSLQTTELVNEACLRLINLNRVQWQDHAHFLAIASTVMRQVLVDRARKRDCGKRGADPMRVPMEETLAVAHHRDLELIALDEALSRLAELFPRKSCVVELRFFGGLTIKQTAAVLDVSTDTVKSELRTAKLWLLREMNGAAAVGGQPDAEGTNDGSETMATH